MDQLKRHSLLEAFIGTAIGFGVSWLANMLVLPLFGFSVTASAAAWIGVIFTIVSVIRSYYVRRLFNYLHRTGVL